MLQINKLIKGELTYYEALFTDGNLYAFSMSELLSQLKTIYGIETLLTDFNLN